MIPRLLEHIPDHSRYVEVFGGSAELLFQKPRSPQEIYNDINGYLVNLFLQVRDQLNELQERLYWLVAAERDLQGLGMGLQTRGSS